MDQLELTNLPLELPNEQFAAPQRSGELAVLPLVGNGDDGRFIGPLSGLKLAGVRGYGNVEIENPSGRGGGLAIVPLHMGYIQDRAQNHALCRSTFVAAGQKILFRDACCVQAAQGGYLQAAEQWFFILPLHLREEALGLRRVENYGKLWKAIARLNSTLGLPDRGHLEQIVCRQRAYLTQYASRFEVLPGQRGALFFLGNRLVGFELAPSPAYFAEVWMPLVCFCYGVAAMAAAAKGAGITHEPRRQARPMAANDLDGIRRELFEGRRRDRDALLEDLRAMPPQEFAAEEEERFLDLSLSTLVGRHFAGQVVHGEDGVVYASLFARQEYLAEVEASLGA